MDDFYGRDWAEHRHKLFDAIRGALGWISLSRLRESEGAAKRRKGEGV